MVVSGVVPPTRTMLSVFTELQPVQLKSASRSHFGFTVWNRLIDAEDGILMSA
ncbi:hypothetical protein D3C83_109770 [compost metagenome]